MARSDAASPSLRAFGAQTPTGWMAIYHIKQPLTKCYPSSRFILLPIIPVAQRFSVGKNKMPERGSQSLLNHSLNLNGKRICHREHERPKVTQFTQAAHVSPVLRF